jgi:hypothetical protein
MNGTISGHLIYITTGEIASSSEISLVRVGVLGERFTQAGRRGRFAFSSLQKDARPFDLIQREELRLVRRRRPDVQG